LADLRGNHNLSGVSASAGYVASWTRGTQVTLSGSLKMHTSETVSSLAAHNAQIFVAGYGVAYAIVAKEQRALGPAVQ